jgi:amiloride-sensitive sodium channel
VVIYFKDIQFVTPIRSEVYGVMDFIADLGGLFGLFMGFSLLSFVELIYYCTVRPFALARRRTLRRKQKRSVKHAIWQDLRMKSAIW